MSDERDIFQLLVDRANAAGLEFILIGGHAVNARGYARTTLDIDFLIAARDLPAWRALLAELRYTPIHQVEAFAQFQPEAGDGFRIDLMLVESSTFTKISAGSELLPYGDRTVRVAGVLHLIALKLHATRTWTRAVQGKDYYDILNLIRLHRVDTRATNFRDVLDRYASATIRERLLLDLERDV